MVESHPALAFSFDFITESKECPTHSLTYSGMLSHLNVVMSNISGTKLCLYGPERKHLPTLLGMNDSSWAM